MDEKKIFVYTDGGARGNPGPAGLGIVFYDSENKIVGKISRYLGERTNNQAEYLGVIEALRYLIKNKKIYDTIFCYLDSELIVQQLNGKYKIKNEGLKPLYWQVRDLVMSLGGKIQFVYIPRLKNKQADQLVNKAIDEAKSV